MTSVKPLEYVPMSLRRAVRRNGRKALVEGVLATRQIRGERTLPDYVIVGAQRCGTTSLFRALVNHRGVMANVLGAKGVHYFDTDFHRGLDWYKAHFPSQEEREKHEAEVGHPAVVGEASPYYMFHPMGIERMAEAVPDTKLIVLLRDPVKRAISHHLHMVWEGHEPVEDLDKALDLEAERLAGVEDKLRADPKFRSRDHQHYSYIARGHYAPQVERILKHYPRDQVLIMATSELTGQSVASLERIQRFIGLEPDPAITLGKRNASDPFVPREETVSRLKAEYAESNKRLAELVDISIPWA